MMRDKQMSTETPTQYETERPLALVTLPKESSRAHLTERLVREYKMRSDHAAAIGRALVDPTAVRRQLDSPLIKRFPGGVAKFIIADVFTPMISVNPVNPRERERRAYPVSGMGGGAKNKTLTVEADGTNTALILTGDSPEHVEEILRDSAAHLRHQNASLGEDIGVDGALEPLTVALTEIRHRDGTDKVIALTAMDGATRVSWCHQFTSFDSADVVYRLTSADSRTWRSELGRITAIQNQALAETTFEDRRAHRALIAQARILLSIEPVRPGAVVPSIVEAIRAILAEIHVAPPKGWPEGSQIDEIADKVLDLLLDAGRITETERNYLMGMIPPDQLKRHGFSVYPDVRAAKLLRVFHEDRNSAVISAAVRGLGEKKRLAKDDKIKLAAELIMRPYRHTYRRPGNDLLVHAVRSAVQRTFTLPGVRKNTSWEISPRSLGETRLPELRDAALAELRANTSSEELGAARLELGVLASYWLTATRALQRDTPQDTRGPSAIIVRMLRDERGIHQLYQVIVDGRHEPSNISRAARRVQLVEKNGEKQVDFIELAGGDYERVNDDWIRHSFHEAQLPLVPQKNLPPIDQMMELVRQATKHGRELKDLMDKIVKVKDEHGDIIAERYGVPRPQEIDIEEALRDAADNFRSWIRQHERTNRAITSPDEHLSGDEQVG